MVFHKCPGVLMMSSRGVEGQKFRRALEGRLVIELLTVPHFFLCTHPGNLMIHFRESEALAESERS